MALKSNLVRLAGPLGLYSLARRLSRRTPRVLMYHRFAWEPSSGFTSLECFRRQVRHIKQHYNPMTLGHLIHAIENEGHAPPNTVVITIDDGYRDFYEIAFPVLKEEGVPATLFVATGFIDRALWLWPDQVRWLLERAEEIPESVVIGRVTLAPGRLTRETRDTNWTQLINHLLKVPDEEKHRLIEELATELGLTLPVEAPQAFQSANWDEIREIHEGGIEIGGHTVTHPSLGQVDRQQAEREIVGCRDAIERHLGHRPRSFCYPNGQREDYTPEAKHIVQEAGFSAAVTAFPDRAGISERYEMRRHTGGDDWFQFMKSVSGLEWLGHRLREGPL